MLQSWITERHLRCLRRRSTDFGSLTLRVIKRESRVLHLEIIGQDWSRFQMNLIARNLC